MIILKNSLNLSMNYHKKIDETFFYWQTQQLLTDFLLIFTFSLIFSKLLIFFTDFAAIFHWQRISEKSFNYHIRIHLHTRSHIYDDCAGSLGVAFALNQDHPSYHHVKKIPNETILSVIPLFRTYIRKDLRLNTVPFVLQC